MLLIILLSLNQSAGTQPIREPIQDGDFCNRLKVTGTGTFEVGVTVKDRQLALDYANFLTGDGDLEMDSTTVEAQRAAKLPGMGDGSAVPLNLWDNAKLSYSGKTPMIGTKYIHSDAFWGGIGAKITENFAVTEMDRDGSTYFASTNPASYITDPKKIAEIMKASPVHTVAIKTKNAFNGTWNTDASMHKLLSKDVKVHESFSGKFEVDKLLKFHENPIAEKKDQGCKDLDC